MKKVDFIKMCAAKANLSQKDMKEVLVAVGEAIVEAMKDEDGVSPFTGMKFSAEYKEPHDGRNPLTGESIRVPGKYRPKVKFGAYVKNAINA